MKEKAYELCKKFIGGAWKQISCNDMVFSRISGGLTNLLYRCSLPASQTTAANEPNNVLLRLYGKIHEDGTGDAVVKENVIFMLLSERRLGPKLYGIFSGGRLEEYIPAPSLKRKDLRDPMISSYIAEKLALVHKLNVPINKEPTFVYKTGMRWLTNINLMLNRKPETEEEQMKFSKVQSFNLDAEFQWLWSVLKKVNSPVVFSHNDVQEGNILHNPEAVTRLEKVIFIDFEFCCYNYRAFDFANHFLEWAYDYEVKTAPYYRVEWPDYPTKKQQLHFLRYYNMSVDNSSNGIQQNIPVDMEYEPTADEENMLFEIEVFVLLSHMFWALWGYVNAYTSKILFGYWDFADHRMEEYFKHKGHLLSTNKRFASLVKDIQ